MIALVLAGVYASGAVSAVLWILAINALWPDPALDWRDDALTEPASDLSMTQEGPQRGRRATDAPRRSI